jgi:flagellar basal body-associated protein FliL
MSSILDQTLLAPNSSYHFFRQNTTAPIASFSEGNWESNKQLSYVVPKKIMNENGLQIIPEYIKSTGELDMNVFRTYALNSQMDSELRALFSKILDIDLARRDNSANRGGLAASLYDDVSKKAEMIDFSEELTDDITTDQQRQEFQNQKAKLMTLMMKNKNIKNRLNDKKLTQLILLGILSLYVIILSLLFLHGSMDIGVMNNMVNRSSAAIVMILTSMLVIIIYTIVDVYMMIFNKNQNFEHFIADERTNPLPSGMVGTTSVNTNVAPTDLELIGSIRTYVEKLPTVSSLKQQLKTSVSDKRASAIQNILNDFGNMNFINMRRYQLTDYKVNKAKQTISLSIKYGFMLVSVIGLLGGFKLRSDNNRAAGNISGLIISSGMFMVMSLMLVVTYVIILVKQNRENSLRRQYNWNKLYFTTEDTGKNIQN